MKRTCQIALLVLLLIASRSFCSAQDVPVDANRWILMSDTHITEITDEPKNDTFPAQNLAQAISEVLELNPRPAGVIISGDCVAIAGKSGDYAVLRTTVAPLETAGIPVHFALGNHDNLEAFYEAFPERKDRVPKSVTIGEHITCLETPHADWILLDSLTKTNFTPGEMGEEQLAWLDKRLSDNTDKPVLLVAHHPLDFSEKARENSALRDTAEFFQLMTAHEQVKAYIYGHSHAYRIGERDGVHLVNIPAMGWIFDKKQPRAWIDCQLEEDGATLTIHALDKSDPRHEKQVRLSWR